ncbi:MAG: NYN domain-containing protein [Deltaproteobacteria bacterium]|nr:NYN domain-containing protein [Deltaproteobacteria bacterium]
MARGQVRLSFDNLLQLALAGRELGDAAVVGSIPPEQRALWDRLERATGVKPELYERGTLSGGEQGLDQCLQVHMLRAISDCRDPQVAVLMTGDGAGYDDGVGFHADMERMHRNGWGIEVISWNESCKRTLKEWASKNGVFVPLDDYYESVTFLEGVRSVRPLNLKRRAMDSPRLSPAREAEERARREYEAKMEETMREIEALKAEKAAKNARKAKYERRFKRNAKKQ